MNAGQLKEQLMGIPDDAEILFNWDGELCAAAVDSCKVWRSWAETFHSQCLDEDYVEQPALVFSRA
jgi:hypothetical protein